jgi:hypothetical protein
MVHAGLLEQEDAVRTADFFPAGSALLEPR